MNPRSLPLSSSVFTILSGLIEERLGLFFSSDDSDLLAEKVSPRAIERGFDSLLDYYYFLRYDPAAEAELAPLADALVVNETYFGRERDQLAVLVDRLLPRLLEERDKVRLWSAACSTGEEPLTLAGMLSERGLLPRVELVASDISQRALATAKAGQFKGRSLRALPPGASAWLDIDGPVATVKESVARSVSWHHLNLVDLRAVEELGRFDVILCRNVLIYFRDATIKALAAAFEASLTRGGYLLIGASESLLRFGAGLQCEEHGGAFFYRKAPL
jgi:chemotaxis protein methyltransferase CheR